MIVTPQVRRLAIAFDFVARPRSDRSHQNVTPMMGGVAIFLVLGAAILVLSSLLEVISRIFDIEFGWSLQELLIAFASGTLLGLVGLFDDKRNLIPPIKFALQLPSVIILVMFTEITIHLPIPEIFNIVLTIGWFVFLINAFNFMDNMDGVAAIVSATSAMFFVVIATFTEQYMVAALAAAIAGTSVGFLRYNLFEVDKKIFMGDAGSLFLGFWLAVIGIKLKFDSPSPLVTWPVPVLVLGIPIFDTCLVFFSRTRRGLHILKGGTDHTSHRLFRAGLGRYGVPFAIGMINAILGCLALLVMVSNLATSISILVTVILMAFYVLYKIEITAPYEFITGKPKAETPLDLNSESPSVIPS